MSRGCIWWVGWAVFLGLAVGSLYLVLQFAPPEEAGQAILTNWCPGLFVFSAITVFLRRSLMRDSGLTDSEKKKKIQ